MAENSIGYHGSGPLGNDTISVGPNMVLNLTEPVTLGTNIVTPSPIEQFGSSYGRIHGWLSIAVCVFGIVSNALNIVVLTRKHMLSPTNYILTALAIADMLTMSTYPIMAGYLYIKTQPDCDGYNHPKEWMFFILFHNLFIVTCHNMAMWLTVALAVFRYIFVCIPSRAITLCTTQRAKLTVVLIFVITIIVCCPNYVIYQVSDIGKSMNSSSCYFIIASEFAQNHSWYQTFVRWLYGVVIKILPCILLVFLSTLLILAMQQAKRRRARLLGMSSRSSEHDNQSSEHNRTTAMLVAVVMFFVITELPQGILALVSSVSNDLWRIYISLGDFMDFLVLLNSAVNFILYCIMSQQFRDTFKNLFVSKSNASLFGLYNHKQNGASYSVVKTDTTMV